MNALDDGNETALYRACRMGNNRVVQLLIENGAQINVYFQQGMSAQNPMTEFYQ